MRKDFQELPPREQTKMIDMLEKADPEHVDWWARLLYGDRIEDAFGYR